MVKPAVSVRIKQIKTLNDKCTRLDILLRRIAALSAHIADVQPDPIKKMLNVGLTVPNRFLFFQNTR
ncbi:MAG: hypothetical protein J5830_06150, partial [Clostridia bacterium]|nr:hypothetical protein [Clostridia bacterium]